jgi:hypothetical protein
MSTYIVTLRITDDNDGRARRDVKAIVRRGVNDAAMEQDWNDRGLHLNDITVAEVVD